jgi:hypothetical protein
VENVGTNSALHQNMNDADKYRKEAEHCREQAARAISPLDKEAWLLLAADWLLLAQHAETRC